MYDYETVKVINDDGTVSITVLEDAWIFHPVEYTYIAVPIDGKPGLYDLFWEDQDVAGSVNEEDLIAYAEQHHEDQQEARADDYYAGL